MPSKGLRIRTLFAKRLKITKRALYDIRQSKDFREVYERVSVEFLHSGADVLKGSYTAAAKLLREVVEDPIHFDNRDRIAAARFLVENGTKFLEKLDEKAKDADDELIPVKRGDDE
jgi:hypothetical protein